MSLSYYSRMRFTHNLLPLLTSAPHFARSLSILSAGFEAPLNLTDLDLKTSFSLSKCADHTITMNTLMTTEFAKRNPSVGFVHSYPSAVDTGLMREMPLWARVGLKVVKPLMGLFFVGKGETGDRQLFVGSSGVYPAKGRGSVHGLEVPSKMEVACGTDGVRGSGGYMANWTGEPAKRKGIVREYVEGGVGEKVWEHTMGVFERAERINAERKV